MTIEMFEIKAPTKTCKDCIHRAPTQCGGKVIQYCKKKSSNRTENGLLKIKVHKPACSLHQKND